MTPPPRRWLRIAVSLFLILALALLLFGQPLWLYTTAVIENGRRIANEQWLEETTTKSLSWKEITFRGAIDDINRKIANSPGHPSGLRLEICTEAERQIFFRRRLGSAPKGPLPDIPGPEPTPLPPTPRPILNPDDPDFGITIEIGRPPLREAIRYVVSLTGWQARIDGSSRILLALGDSVDGTIEPLIAVDMLILAGLYERSADSIDIMPLLQRDGILFYEGSFARYDPRTSILSVKTTQEQLDRLPPIVRPKSIAPHQTLPCLQSWFRHPTPPLPTPAPESPAAPSIAGLDPIPSIPGLESPRSMLDDPAPEIPPSTNTPPKP